MCSLLSSHHREAVTQSQLDGQPARVHGLVGQEFGLGRFQMMDMKMTTTMTTMNEEILNPEWCLLFLSALEGWLFMMVGGVTGCVSRMEGGVRG